MEPVLVEESTPTRLASALKDLVETLGEDAIHHDYMMALVIVVMAETGFSVTSSSPPDTDGGYKKRPRVIPSDWRSSQTGNYAVKFILHHLTDRGCKILAIPCGDTLIINLLLLNESKKAYSMAVPTVKYVNMYSSDLAGRYLNLKEFSFKFKNTITTPARCEILSAAGMVHASLPGLPAEIKIRILGMLDAYSLTRIAQTSEDFRQLSGESRIWKNLLKRDFPSVHLDGRDYRGIYQRCCIRDRNSRRPATDNEMLARRYFNPSYISLQLPGGNLPIYF